MPEAAQAALREGTVGGAVFFSPRTGAAFARLVQMSDLGDSCTYMTAYCLSMAVAEAVGPLDWGAVEVAEVPTQEALLALVGNME